MEVYPVDVQQFVEPAGLCGANLGDVGHVDRHEHCSATGRFDLSDRSVGPFLHHRQVGKGDRCALGGEELRCGCAEPAAPNTWPVWWCRPVPEPGS